MAYPFMFVQVYCMIGSNPLEIHKRARSRQRNPKERKPSQGSLTPSGTNGSVLDTHKIYPDGNGATSNTMCLSPAVTAMHASDQGTYQAPRES